MDEVKVTDYPHQKEQIYTPGGARWRYLVFLRSNQPKPNVGIAYPDAVLETDTGNLYYYNDATHQWDAQ